MWVLIKLSLVIVGFFVRYLRNPNSKLPEDRVFVNGDTIHYRQKKHKGTINSTTFEILLPTHAYFKLTEESWVDRLLKGMGFSEELQTRDENFDRHIYIASDSEAVQRALRSSQEARDLISKLFRRGCKNIAGDGKRVSFHFKGDLSLERGVHNLISELKQTLLSLSIRARSIFDDSFFYKALLIESVIYSLGIAGALGAIQIFIISRYGDLHLNAWDLVRPGLAFAAFLFISVMAFVVFFMRGSSRGHRIIVESALVLCFGVPTAGIDMIGDFNMSADNSRPIKIRCKIVELRKQEHRGRRGRTYYTYHLRPQRMNPGTIEKVEGIEVPYSIQISSDNYHAAFGRKYVTLNIGRGALGVPWYRSMRFDYME